MARSATWRTSCGPTSTSSNRTGRAGSLAEMRCHLFALEALLHAHIDREERFLMPLLADTRAEDVSKSASAT